MKTPEEIKKGLSCRVDNTEGCFESVCTYSKGYCLPDFCTEMRSDALAYIQQLEADTSRLTDTIRSLTEQLNAAHDETAKAMRGRDALMPFVEGRCETCAFLDDCSKHDGDPNGQYVRWYEDCEDWEWRGVCPENTEVQEDAQ